MKAAGHSLKTFARADSGAINIMFALALPLLIGVAGLAFDVGIWLTKQNLMQGAADSSALSSAVAGGNSVEAQAVASTYGFVNGTLSTIVEAAHPPTSGPYVGSTSAVEVRISQPQPLFFAKLFLESDVEITARAVAKYTGKGCVVALNAAASGAASVQGSSAVALNGCSLAVNSAHASALTVGGAGSIAAMSVSVVGGETGADKITTTEGNQTGTRAVTDPYEMASFGSFSGCAEHNFTAKTVLTINPGVYCGGIQVNAGAVLTLNPGIYFLDRGCFCVSGGATVKGVGVTLVFTSSTGSGYATATINGGATIELIAPTSGPTAGIVFFGDRNMPAGLSFKLNGGSNQTFGGALYLPKAAITFAGGSGTGAKGCTQLVADTISFSGNSNFALNCEGYGIKPLGAAAELVE